MEKKFIKKEELNDLRNLKNQINNIITTLGKIEANMINMINQKDKLADDFLNIQQKESELMSEIHKNYGPGNISLETGEFTPDP